MAITVIKTNREIICCAASSGITDLMCGFRDLKALKVMSLSAQQIEKY